MYRERLVHAALAGLALALLTFSVPGSAVAQVPGSTSLRAGFNGTPIPAGSSLWFNSVFKVKLPALPAGTTVNVFLDDVSLTVTPKGGNPQSYHVPSAQITFDPAATQATTTHDPVTNTFFTTVPASFRDNVFLTGLALPLPDGLPPGPVLRSAAPLPRIRPA